MRVTRKPINIVIVTALLAACTGNTASPAAEIAKVESVASNIGYEWQQIMEELPDENSPAGYWETDVRYPRFFSAEKDYELRPLNIQLEALHEKYSCTKRGDTSFSVDIKYISDGLVSLTYDAMWFCPNMVTPDSRSGVLNYNPKAGKNLVLADEIADGKADSLKGLLTKKAEQEANNGNEACHRSPAFDQSYRDDDMIVFRFSREEHGVEDCLISLPHDQLKSYFKQGSPFISANMR